MALLTECVSCAVDAGFLILTTKPGATVTMKLQGSGERPNIVDIT
jgi:hypothetical protein